MAYIGKSPSQAVRNRYFFTASGGETSISSSQISGFSFSDGAYTDVYLNGVLLVAGTDYNTNTANTIAGLSALVASDIVEIVVYDTFSVFGGTFNGTIDTTGLNVGSSTAVTAILDEDNMASDSATSLATQQSIKAYVDTQVATVPVGDITEVTAGTGLTGGGASGAVTLNVVGGTGITANADDIAIDATVATLTGTQTLTNKTLGATSVTADISFGDNDKAIFGAGSDLQITHTGSHSQIVDSGTGGLFIGGSSQIGLMNAALNEYMVNAVENGAVTLYHDNSVKLATTSSGATVTGSVTVNNDGALFFGDNSTYISGSGAANRLKFITGGSEAIRIDSSQRVGIGTSSPSSLLTAEKDFGNNSGSSAVALQIGNISTVSGQTPGTRLLFNSGNRESGAIDVNHNTAGGDNASMNFVVRDGANTMTERMRITSGGTLAIATTSPESQAKLQANGSAIFIHNHTDTSSSGNVSYLAGNQALTLVNAQGGANNLTCKLGFSIPTTGANSDGLIEYGSTAAGSGEFRFYTESGNTIGNRMTIDSAGFVGIGESDPKKMVHITKNDSDGLIILDADGATTDHQICFSKDYGTGGTTGGNYWGIGVDGSENKLVFAYDPNAQASLSVDAKVVLDSSGNMMVGTTSASGRKFSVQSSQTTGNVADIRTTDTGNYNAIVLQVGCHRNTTNGTYDHFACTIHGDSDRLLIKDSGQVQNANGSYTTISDSRMKENITDASSQWDDIKAVRLRNFNMIGDDLTQLGVVAQELEASGMTGLVGESNWYDVTANPDNEKRKYVKQSILYMKALGALQEAIAKIETLETQRADLETRLTTLENA